MERKKGLIAGILICISLQLVSCGRQRLYIVEKLLVGFKYYDQSDTFLNQLLICLKEQLQEYENDAFETALTIRSADGSQRVQEDQVKELIDAGCNVLCVNLVDRADPSEIIDLARDNHVPIIFFNREPVAADMMQWDELYYVGADARQSGVMQGELAADWIR